MSDVTIVGLGFQGNANNRFQSVDPNQAPGSDAFFSCVLVQVKESLLSSPTECSYFGNFDGGFAGWEIGRSADTPASDPPNTPEFVTFRVRLGNNGALTALEYTCDASSIFGRTHLLAVSVVGLVATLYINAAAVAQETLADPLTLGTAGLTYGNTAGGGTRSGDPIISAAYSSTDAANFILQQRALFDLIRTSGKLSGAITALGLSAGYIYESFQQKAPISGTPTTPLKNFGTQGVNGNLIFVGTAALVVNADPDPDFTGGAQSPSTGPGAVNLQDAYDAGPTGLIVTGGPGPFGVDDVRIEDNEVRGIDSATAPTELFVRGGDALANDIVGANVTVRGGNALGGDADGGAALVVGGQGFGGFSGGSARLVGGATTGTNPGGSADVVGGAATEGAGGDVGMAAGDGGVDGTAGQLGGNVFIAGGDAGASNDPDPGVNGGQVIIRSGNGGNGTGGGSSAGNGGELNIEAGTAGTAAGGAAEGVGGNLVLSAGNGGDGTGGNASLTSGNGDTQSGNLTINVGSGSLVGLLSILGGNPSGIGSGPGGSIAITGGDAANGEPQTGGNVDITGGLGATTSSGGDVHCTGGTSAQGPGGSASLEGGAGGGGVLDNGGFGGTARVIGGNATQPNQAAGEVQIQGGDATGTGGPALGGNIHLRGGNSTNSNGGVLLLTTGSGPTAATAGTLEAALSGGTGGAASTVGGFFLDPANGRLSLRTYAVGGVDTGSLRLHQLDNAAEAAQTVDDGLLHYQTEQAAGDEITIGFRAAKSGNYGLMGRCYSRTFDAADAPGDVLTVTHNLDAEVVQYAIYDPAGLKAFESVTQIVGVQAISDDVLEVSFNSGFITAGTWRVAVFGY